MATIDIDHLTKRFGTALAVADLSFSVEAGSVTGFLGRNGAGKTTTLRALLGLITPTSGTATINGRRYRDLPAPARTVGAVLEATSFHPGRRARDHLAIIAAAGGIARHRIRESLELVGLADVSHRRVGGFSLGMRQRLGLAGALLGEPEVLVLDEPTNGLDPDGIRWLRNFVRTYAAAGATVIISSHLLAEVAQTVDHVVIIDHGRHVRTASIEELTSGSRHGTRVRTPMAAALIELLQRAGFTPRPGDAGHITGTDTDTDTVIVPGATTEEVGRLVAAAGLVVHEMGPLEGDLEAAFFDLTNNPTNQGVPA